MNKSKVRASVNSPHALSEGHQVNGASKECTSVPVFTTVVEAVTARCATCGSSCRLAFLFFSSPPQPLTRAPFCVPGHHFTPEVYQCRDIRYPGCEIWSALCLNLLSACLRLNSVTSMLSDASQTFVKPPRQWQSSGQIAG